jgi:cell wall-associated NlpC family hydrolase
MTVAATARQWLGVPCSWPAPDGGDSDCADFVNAVYDGLMTGGGCSHEDPRA